MKTQYLTNWFLVAAIAAGCAADFTSTGQASSCQEPDLDPVFPSSRLSDSVVRSTGQQFAQNTFGKADKVFEEDLNIGTNGIVQPRKRGEQSVVAGGSSAPPEYGAVGGGIGNNAYGTAATVAGGMGNGAVSGWATVGGGRGNISLGSGSVIAGGVANSTFTNGATIGGGFGNHAAGEYSTVAGGESNKGQAFLATIGGGLSNLIGMGADAAVIGGGRNNRIEAIDAGISGGSATGATIAGGERNVIRGAVNAAILGGADNSAQGSSSAVLSGEQNQVGFDHSVVSGKGAVARKSHSVTHGAMFAQPGDAQSGQYVLTTTTFANTSQRLVGPRLPTGSAYAFTILISGKASGDASAGFEVKGLVRNYGTDVRFVGAPLVTVLGREGALSSLTVQTEIIDQAPAFRVGGDVSPKVRWVGTLQTSEVAF